MDLYKKIIKEFTETTPVDNSINIDRMGQEVISRM